MNPLKSNILILYLVIMGLIGSTQQGKCQVNQSLSPKLIAVVNKATWCGVCKANGKRFEELMASYASKGISIYTNDLTDKSTAEASKKTLQEAGVYDAVITVPVKGVRKMLKSCRLVKDKKQMNQVAGIVTFINPITQLQLKQESIAIPDAEMKSTIDELLN